GILPGAGRITTRNYMPTYLQDTTLDLSPRKELTPKLQTLHPHHVEHVVRIHLESFPTFFLSFLGARFLRELYGSFLVDPVGVGLVAVNQEDKVIGVAVGAIDPRGYFTRLLKRRWWAFCLGSIGAVAKRPSVTPRLFRALYYRGEPPTGPV